MKRLLLLVFAVLLVGQAWAQSYIKMDGFNWRQDGDTVTVTGQVKNDGPGVANKIEVEAQGLVGEGQSQSAVTSQAWTIYNVSGGGSKRSFKFTFKCGTKLSTVQMRVGDVRT